MQAMLDYPGVDIPVLAEEYVAIRKEDWAEIRKAIDEAIRTGIHPQGWRRVTAWLKEWGLVGTAITVPLALCAICVSLGIFVVSDLTKNTEFRTHTDDRLTSIDKDIKEIRAEFEHFNRRTLAQTRNALDAAQRNGRVLPDSELADYIQASHEIPASIPDYWKTVAAIINYQSWLNQKSGRAVNPSRVAKPCFPKYFVNNRINGGSYADCIVTLDANSFEDLTFTDSVIKYHGGPISLSNVTFVNCRFIIDVPAQPLIAPTSPQRRLLLTLLDSRDQANLKISAPQS